jgi:hypothetical protein
MFMNRMKRVAKDRTERLILRCMVADATLGEAASAHGRSFLKRGPYHGLQGRLVDIGGDSDGVLCSH